MNVTPPLFISSRLMAAVTIEGDTGGIVNLAHTGRSGEGRQTYNWLVETHNHMVLGEGDDVSSGCGDEPDYTAMMESLLGFLEAGAESYRYTMSGGTSGNSGLFPPAVMEWAYMNSDELATTRGMIDPDNTEEEVNEADDQPEEEDGFVFGNAEASFAGKYLGSFADEDEAEAAILAAGREGAGFFPNVWRVSDHGNHHLIENFWSDDAS